MAGLAPLWVAMLVSSHLMVVVGLEVLLVFQVESHLTGHRTNSKELNLKCT